MKKRLLSIIFFLSWFWASSQVYHNEWINFSQSYYKIKIVKDGLYKLDSATLANAGVPVGTMNPKNIQLFQKGQELYIHVQGENDNDFNTSDYILFYAEKNTCKDDSTLFVNSPFLVNPYYSVINDTAAVFLTWNNSTNNKRLIPENDIAFNLYTAAPYYIKESIQAFNQEYCIGPVNQTSKTTDPRYVFGEGFAAPVLEISANNPSTASTTLAFNTNGLYAAGPQAYLNVVYSGASNQFYGTSSNADYNDHELSIELNDMNNTWNQLDVNSFDGYKTYRRNLALTNSIIGASTQIKVSSNYSPALYLGNRTYLHYVSMVYPQSYTLNNLSEEKMWVPDNASQSKAYLNISNFNNQSSPVFLIDITNHKIISTVQNGSNFQALVSNSGGLKFCFLASESSTHIISTLSKVNGTGTFVNYQSLAVDSAYIIVTHTKLLNGAGQYAAYRASAAGGGHHVITANIKDLCDQFAYGVEGHPHAIKNFIHYGINTFPTSPKNLFIIGKSVHILKCLNNPVNSQKRLVPSFGYPSSDILLTQGIVNPASLAPAVATGRLAAQNDTDIVNYLNKVVLYDALPVEAWQKNVLHFVGGTNSSDQGIFNQYMNNFKTTIEDTLYGAHVSTFRKTSTAPIGINTNDSIKDVIENGVSLITFFGHGSTTGFEQNIDDPYAYNNSPKFPMLVANSCYTGDIHTHDVISNSEKFVLAKNHGTIGFLATVSSGVTYSLANYTGELYKNISYRTYGKTYGEAVKEGVAYTQGLSSTDTTTHITTLEMTLHGDPACKSYAPRCPDYAITNSDVSFDIKSIVDSINIDIKISNIGKSVNDSMFVYVERIFPNATSSTFLKKIKAPLNQDHLIFNIDKNIIKGVGLNKFSVRVDYFNSIVELSELNNSTTGYINVFIPGGDIVPVYPYEYAIVPDTAHVVLKASTADPFAPPTVYRLQLDTNDTFLNPLINTTITASGGVVTLPVNLPGKDSTVYFWRIAKDSSNPSAINWRESSFQTIKTKHGWEQAHFHQFKNDQYQFIKYNKPVRRFDFFNDVKTVFCRTGYVSAPYNYMNFADNSYYINNAQQVYWTCGQSGWTFVLLDSISGIPAKADTVSPAPNPGTWYSQYFSCACIPTPRPAFDFGPFNSCNDNVNWKTRIEQFLNIIPVGTRVLAYSHDNDSATTFSPALRQAFAKIGSDSIPFKPDTCQMIIFGTKKTAPHTNAHEVIGKKISDIVTLTDTMRTKWNSGFIASGIIGPSVQWRSLHWRYASLDNPVTDSIYLKLIGIKANGTTDTLAVIKKDSLDVLNLSNYINAVNYPYMQLMAFERDDVNHTAPQLKRWQVIYDEAPEAAINPPLGYSISSPAVQEGDKITIKLPVQNISTAAFSDSLLITYWIEDANQVSHSLPYKLKKKPFNPDSVIIDTIKINTLGYGGDNALWVDVNALNHPKNQLEQYHFNNIIRIPFRINRDNINPLLDVTFDGVHILNGDIISSKPAVLITLKDENKYLALNDTADFAIYLRIPGAAQEQRIYFNNGLQFIPAQLPVNSCKIVYTPDLPNDGKYELTVQAKDKSDNLSGANNYKIQFEIVNRSTITDVLNYPNPFSTSTRFVFTLTGSEVPETFKIQILTITGKVVREIHRDELGPIHIGRNITEYAWNGKDDFGDQLANGVYLYRVVTRLNGQTIEHRDSGADEYIKKGFGKMVLMR